MHWLKKFFVSLTPCKHVWVMYREVTYSDYYGTPTRIGQHLRCDVCGKLKYEEHK